jgi:hypothetical protein
MSLDPEAARPLDDITTVSAIIRDVGADMDTACREGSAELGFGEDAQRPCEHFAAALRAMIDKTEGRIEVQVEEPSCDWARTPCGARGEHERATCEGGGVHVAFAGDATDDDIRTASVIERRYPALLLANRTLDKTASAIDGTSRDLANVPEPCFSSASSAFDAAHQQLVDRLESTRPVVGLLTHPQ